MRDVDVVAELQFAGLLDTERGKLGCDPAFFLHPMNVMTRETTAAANQRFPFFNIVGRPQFRHDAGNRLFFTVLQQEGRDVLRLGL